MVAYTNPESTGERSTYSALVLCHRTGEVGSLIVKPDLRVFVWPGHVGHWRVFLSAIVLFFIWRERERVLIMGRIRVDMDRYYGMRMRRNEMRWDGMDVWGSTGDTAQSNKI